MTVAALPSSIAYIENGATLAFAAPFRFLANSIQVSRVLADGTVNELLAAADFSVTGGDTDAGGTVTLAASIAGSTLRIKRVTPRAQSMDYTTGDRFTAESHEGALDRSMLVDQEQDAMIDDIASRAILVPDGEDVGPLAAKDDRAGYFLGFDAEGNPALFSGSGADSALRQDLAAATGPNLIGYRPTDTSAPARPAQAKLDDTMSVRDWGAVGDGVSNDTAFIQAAINFAIANNRALDVPPRRYILNATLNMDFTGSNRGLDICGRTGNDILGNRGSIFDFAGLVGANAMNVTGASAQAFLTMTGITVIGSANANHGIQFVDASYSAFERCVFRDFSKVGYAAIRYAPTPSKFTGIASARRCLFQSNDMGIHILGDNNNVFDFENNLFLDHAKVAFMVGGAGLLQQNRCVNLVGNTFEGNKRDIWTLGGMHQLAILRNYFENNSGAVTDPRIEIGYTAPNAGSGAINISDNEFQKELVDAGNAMIKLEAIDHAEIKRNFSATGIFQDRFLVDGLNCTNVEFDVADTAAGETPAYPIRIGRAGAPSQKIFKYSASTEDLIDFTTLRFMGAAESYPGASTSVTNSAVYTRQGSAITVSLDLQLSAKAGGSTGAARIGGLPFVNTGADFKFPIAATTSVTGTGPFFGIIPNGASYINLVDAAGAALDFPTAMAVGSRVKAAFTYLGQLS